MLKFDTLFAGQDVHIPSLSIRSYLHQNSRTYFMSPERICLLIANFTLVGIYPMLTILQFYCLHTCATSTNQRPPQLNLSVLACFNITYTFKYHDICSLIPL